MKQLRVAPEIEAVQIELQYHPDLREQLAAPGAVKTFEDGVALIASYLDIVLDGEYTERDVAKLFGTFHSRLRAKRGAIIL